MTQNKYILAPVLVGLIVALTANTSAAMADDSTVLETTVALNSQGEYEGQFDTLIAAVQSSDPVVQEALSSQESNITVFAPTDEAFDEIGLDETNVDQISEQQLTGILTYHVSEGAKTAENVSSVDSLQTLNGQNITVQNGTLVDQTNTSANITVTDIQTSNGIIHVIDSVLIPETQ